MIGRQVAWPSGLRRWFKAPVSSEAWVRIPPLPQAFCLVMWPKPPDYYGGVESLSAPGDYVRERETFIEAAKILQKLICSSLPIGLCKRFTLAHVVTGAKPASLNPSFTLAHVESKRTNTLISSVVVAEL